MNLKLLLVFVSCFFLTSCASHEPNQELVKAHAQNNIAEIENYIIEFNPSNATLGTPTFSFFIKDKKTLQPLTILQKNHDKDIHLIIVSRTLQEFQHLHPALNQEHWTANPFFSQQGDYKLWFEFSKDNKHYLTDFEFTISSK